MHGFHFVREILEEGDLVLEKIHTKKNLTDVYKGDFGSKVQSL